MKFTHDELLQHQGSEMVFDVECYPNYFLVYFKHAVTGRTLSFELSPDSEVNYDYLNWVLYHFKLVGFNSISYDIPMITGCSKGFNTLQLKQLSDRIIKEELRWKALEKVIGQCPQRLDHIDLIQLTALAPGLKTLAGRMHSPKMQDLPINPDQHLTQDEAAQIKQYCENDLDNTILLLNTLRPQIDLRVKMSQEYGIDLRSKSDAQIAEAVLSSELEKINGFRPKRPEIAPGTRIKYRMPEYVKFESKVLQDALALVQATEFEIEESGSIGMPKELAKLKIAIGGSIYQMGIGGLHSTEKSQTVKAGDGKLCRDADVSSYYPQIILNQQLYPKQCGKKFSEVYQSIVTKRSANKKHGKKNKG